MCTCAWLCMCMNMERCLVMTSVCACDYKIKEPAKVSCVYVVCVCVCEGVVSVCVCVCICKCAKVSCLYVHVPEYVNAQRCRVCMRICKKPNARARLRCCMHNTSASACPPAAIQKSRQHSDFPGGHPPEYYPSLRLLNFAKRTGYGALSLRWPSTTMTLSTNHPPLADRKHHMDLRNHPSPARDPHTDRCSVQNYLIHPSSIRRSHERVAR